MNELQLFTVIKTVLKKNEKYFISNKSLQEIKEGWLSPINGYNPPIQEQFNYFLHENDLMLKPAKDGLNVIQPALCLKE